MPRVGLLLTFVIGDRHSLPPRCLKLANIGWLFRSRCLILSKSLTRILLLSCNVIHQFFKHCGTSHCKYFKLRRCIPRLLEASCLLVGMVLIGTAVVSTHCWMQRHLPGTRCRLFWWGGNGTYLAADYSGGGGSGTGRAAECWLGRKWYRPRSTQFLVGE